jgi:hypothetical protein
VFFDFDYRDAFLFIPSMQVWWVEKLLNGWKKEVYESNLPFMLPNKQYTAINELPELGACGEYEVRWGARRSCLF